MPLVYAPTQSSTMSQLTLKSTAFLDLQEPELSHKLVWRHMPVVEPPVEKDIPFEVTAAGPQWINFDNLSDAQQMLYNEMQAIVDMAEYILYWSRAGWLPEAETEIED